MIWTSGALYSSAEDLTRFASALFNGTLLNQNSLDQMLTFVPDVTLNELIESFSYGLGVMGYEHDQLGTVWFSVGATVGHFSWMVYLPEKNLSCSLIFNPFPNPPLDNIIPLIEHFIGIVRSD